MRHESKLGQAIRTGLGVWVGGLSLAACTLSANAEAVAAGSMGVGPFDKFETEAPEEVEHARARLVSEHDALTPGKVAYLGVTFDIDKGWHLYWHGRNDTGFPIDIALDLPDGYERLPTQHPVPKRHISPGSILDHVYEDRVTLIVPIKVPKDAKPGSRVTIRGRADWLVCAEVCIPGSGDLRLELPVTVAGEPTKKSRDAKLFLETRARLPKQISDIKSPPRVRWEGEQLLIEAPNGGWIEFYPYEKSAEVRNPIGSQTSNRGLLRLITDARESGKAVHGVVVWKARDGEKDGVVQHQAIIRVEPPGNKIP